MKVDNTVIINWDELDLNYEGENKFASFFSSTGNIHSYPAKAVPEMVNELIKKIVTIHPIHSILDPFVGSGTTALEAKYLGIDFWGSDLNPLAVLLAKAKTLTIHNAKYTKDIINKFVNQTKEGYKECKLITIENFDRIEFWFKRENIRELSYLKMEINRLLKRAKGNRETYALMLLTAFSSTVRKVSLTRNSEFKLYRMSPNDIEKFNISAVDEFGKTIQNLLNMLVVANSNYMNEAKSNIYLKNAKHLDYLNAQQIDLVITSPPYGDSKTTVAYGEFSKLSIQWLDDLIKKYLHIDVTNSNCDELLLGGRKSSWEITNESEFYDSNELRKLLHLMNQRKMEKINEIKKVKETLENLKLKYNETGIIDKQLLQNDEFTYHLICERVRLDIYRKINNNITGMSNKKVKKEAQRQEGICMKELFDLKSHKYYRRQEMIYQKLDKVYETIERNRKTIGKREKEVISFMKDLFQVVKETDRVLKDGGFQVWIVGHRTVMGTIVINMEGIIKEWLINMGYICEASLNRKYSFKRMPHHINSTIERDKEVNTMMNEYILVVRKGNNNE